MGHRWIEASQSGTIQRMAQHMDLDAAELADWLLKSAPDRLWLADADRGVPRPLSMPCTGTEFARFLKQQGGRLRVFAHPENPSASAASLESLALEVADLIEFDIAWLQDDGTVSDHWQLLTDVIAESAERALSQPEAP